MAACSNRNSDIEALQVRAVRCPVGSELQYQPWGKAGLEAFCLLRNGPVAMAEDGHLVLEGQYEMGKKVGQWRWFDTTGEIVKTEDYGGKSR